MKLMYRLLHSKNSIPDFVYCSIFLLTHDVDSMYRALEIRRLMDSPLMNNDVHNIMHKLVDIDVA